MTAAQQDAQLATPATRLAALRGNCMGAAVLLIVQFVLGVGANLYITLPEHKSFLATVFGSAALAAIHLSFIASTPGAPPIPGANGRAARENSPNRPPVKEA